MSPSSFSFDESLLAEDCPSAEPSVRLRRLTSNDAPALAGALSDADVAANLASITELYARADAEAFLAGEGKRGTSLCAGISVDGLLAGVCALDVERDGAALGYWLAKPFQGRGIATLAARALVDLGFAATTLQAVVARHRADNAASGRVLEKLGFEKAAAVETPPRARAAATRLVAYRLNRAAWVDRQPSIETARLVMRPPVMADADAFAELANDRSVGIMTSSMPYPYTRDDARAFILNTVREARPKSLSLTLRLKDDALIGGCGWRGAELDVVELGYWLGADHRGKGFATEAARAVLEAAFRRSGATAARANCRVTNPASRLVLERCGFQWEGTGLVRSIAVSGSVAVDRFRVERDTFLSLRDWGPAAFRNACA